MTTQKNLTEEPVPFLEDEAKAGVVYIKPNLEMKLTDRQKNECRQIVAEIKKFGVTQRQLIFLIDLLVLELENMDSVRRIREVLRQEREQLKDQQQVDSGLILPTKD